MSAVGRIFRSGKRYVLTPYNGYLDFAEKYLSHPNKVLPRHAPSFYDKEKMQAIGNQLRRAKKRIDSNTRTSKPSGVNERPAQTSEAVEKAPEASDTQAVKEVPEPEAPTRQETLDDSSVQTPKTGPRRTETGQPTDGTGGGTQTTNVDAKTPNETQNAQPGGREPSAAEKQADPKSGDKKKKDLQSGDEFNPLKYTEMARDKNLSSSERQMYGRLGTMRENAQKVFKKGTDEQIKNELGRWGIEAKDGATADDYMKKIDEMLKEKAESGPTIGDKFRAHHGVGLTGLGVVGVSTLDLANSRGQQSNAQLYSDPFA